MTTAEFSKFADILSEALSQHYLLGFEIAQLESHHKVRYNFIGHYWEQLKLRLVFGGWIEKSLLRMVLLSGATSYL